MVDLHNYPYAPSSSDALQLHRMYYDKTYDYSGANGIKTINGGWDNSQTKEYIFQRINDWLSYYYGNNHGITLGISEWSPASSDPNVASVVYGSHLGTFANNGVEVFTPWTWYKGMWETMHLFSRYAMSYSVSSASSVENIVSAYTTINNTADSMTVIIVNRDMSSSRKVTVNLNNFSIANGDYATLQLSSLPSNETFVSQTNNALKRSTVSASVNSFTITVPSLSTTAVLLKSPTITGVELTKKQRDESAIFPNPASDNIYVSLGSDVAEATQILIYNQGGRQVWNSFVNYDGHSPINMDVSSLSPGYYLLSVKNSHDMVTKNIVITR